MWKMTFYMCLAAFFFTSVLFFDVINTTWCCRLFVFIFLKSHSDQDTFLITCTGMGYSAQKLQKKKAIFCKPEVFTPQLNGFSCRLITSPGTCVF